MMIDKYMLLFISQWGIPKPFIKNKRHFFKILYFKDMFHTHLKDIFMLVQ